MRVEYRGKLAGLKKVAACNWGRPFLAPDLSIQNFQTITAWVTTVNQAILLGAGPDLLTLVRDTVSDLCKFSLGRPLTPGRVAELSTLSEIKDSDTFGIVVNLLAQKICESALLDKGLFFAFQAVVAKGDPTFYVHSQANLIRTLQILVDHLDPAKTHFSTATLPDIEAVFEAIMPVLFALSSVQKLDKSVILVPILERFGRIAKHDLPSIQYHAKFFIQAMMRLETNEPAWVDKARVAFAVGYGLVKIAGGVWNGELGAVGEGAVAIVQGVKKYPAARELWFDSMLMVMPHISQLIHYPEHWTLVDNLIRTAREGAKSKPEFCLGVMLALRPVALHIQMRSENDSQLILGIANLASDMFERKELWGSDDAVRREALTLLAMMERQPAKAEIVSPLLTKVVGDALSKSRVIGTPKSKVITLSLFGSTNSIESRIRSTTISADAGFPPLTVLGEGDLLAQFKLTLPKKIPENLSDSFTTEEVGGSLKSAEVSPTAVTASLSVTTPKMAVPVEEPTPVPVSVVPVLAPAVTIKKVQQSGGLNIIAGSISGGSFVAHAPAAPVTEDAPTIENGLLLLKKVNALKATNRVLAGKFAQRAQAVFSKCLEAAESEDQIALISGYLSQLSVA